MTSPIRVLRQIVAPNGRHRPRRPLLLPDWPRPLVTVRGRPVLSEDELLGMWPEPELVPHAAVVQCFGFGPPCGRTTAGALNKDGWLCGEFFNHAAGA